MSEKETMRDIFRQAHKEAGVKMERLVRSRIPYSQKVKVWQVVHVGSKGGYTAVRSDVGSYDGYAKGYITNAVENGHTVRPRKSRKNHGYHRRTGRLRVEGLGFYAQARSQAKQLADQQAKKVERQLEEKLKTLGG